ncbi:MULTISPECIES: DUF4190 domain-containing protein [Streptomyces]|uniref:DUF4190 domain-containing protein n=1 Tax=Streptomyces sudanensis TaxID=436397 RepID=A0ABY4THW2_9ACTN|nr:MULTISPECIES: DUF4190 domain-containing protein [Streptomyces]MCP9989168.1 DUF4190 domain-containing protein [Streptomyces sudanensis]URN18495.1 DUF4190 domain-containing protein [Streptomyces sudanensis]
MSSSNHPRTPGDHARPLPDAGGKRGNSLAIAALVLGVAALLLFWTVFGGVVLGLAAVVLGVAGARAARGGRAPHGGMAVAGAVLGALGLIASVVIVVLGASAFDSKEFRNFSECIEHAETQGERDACKDDFDQEVDD